MMTRKKSRLHFATALACAFAIFTTHLAAQQGGDNRQQRNRNGNGNGNGNRNGNGNGNQNASTPAAPGQGYAAFRMAQTRNIFDPDRRPIVQYSDQRPQQQSPPTRSDYVALTGTMVTADKSLAFFSGSRSDYNKVLLPDSSIAGAKITKITPTEIEVERDGKKITVAVGQTVPLDGSAPGAAPAQAPANANTTSSTTDTAPSSPAAVPANASELLKQMMERRQQQLK